jgi:hypothetical protein
MRLKTAFGLGSMIGGNRFNQALENPVLPVNCFAAPAAFTVGNAGRNIVTFAITERWNLQLRFDFQNPFHNWGFNNPSKPGGLQEPATIRKDHRRPDHGFVRGPTVDEPDAAADEPDAAA